MTSPHHHITTSPHHHITTSKKFVLFTIIIVLFGVLGSSCSKEHEKVKDNAKITNTLKIQSRDVTPSLFGNGHIVPSYVAKTLAEKVNMAVPQVMMVGTSMTMRFVDSLFTISDTLGNPIMYIANYVDDGYIVVSADERYEPICALAEHGKYETAQVPSMLLEWFNITCDNILLARSGAISVANNAEKEWVRVIKNIGKEEFLVPDNCCPQCPNYPDCLDFPTMGCGAANVDCNDNGGGTGDPCSPYSTTIKGPLLNTTWGQGCSYNNMCPDKNCTACSTNKNALTGCVATAMAQILRYWANPCTQGYNFTTMPNTFGNTAVQTMMKDLGDAVDMDYGCDVSNADANKTDNVFKDDFCFSSADRNSYSSGSSQTIIGDIDANRPVLLDGCSSRRKGFLGLWYSYSVCHMWVCDGYHKNSNSCYTSLKYHMNWGWGGFANGWYFAYQWNPSNFNFQYSQDLIHNIHP